MNGYRLPTHLPGLIFLIAAIAGCSQGRQQDAAASSLSFGRSVLGVFQNWEAEVLQVDGVSVCHARTTSTSHLVAGQPWSTPAVLRVTEDRFDLKVVDVGREDGWWVVGADDLSGSELARYLETLEADQNAAAVEVSFRLDPESDDSDVGTARFLLRGFSEASAASRTHCAEARASRPPLASPAPIRSLAESRITPTYRWGSLGPDPHVELELASPLFGTRDGEGAVVIKARTHRWWTDDELWISQAELEAWQAESEAWFGEFNEDAELANLFSRGEAPADGLPDWGHSDHWEIYHNGEWMGELSHPGTTSDLAGVCIDPSSDDLRFLRLGWSGSAYYPEELSMFYFTEDDGVREERLFDFEGARVSDFVDCSTAGASPGPCLCKGAAAGQSSEHEAIVNEIWKPIRSGIPAYPDSWAHRLYDDLPPVSLEWTAISEEVMRHQVLEPIYNYSGLRNAITPYADVAMNSEIAVLFLSYGSDRLIFGGANAVFARRLSDTTWTLLYRDPGGGNHATKSGGFVDSDRIAIGKPRARLGIDWDTINVREVLEWGRSFVAFESAVAVDGAPHTRADSSPIGPGDMEFVWVGPGEFLKDADGSDSRDDEGSGTQVEISRGFWLGKYEVTQSEWQSVMGTNPSFHADCGRCPVERVSWDEVQEFIRRVNSREDGVPYRLPTRAEWEYAARAGKTWDHYASSLDTIAWHRWNTERTHPVGEKAPNGWGLYDMVGNVAEWMADENGIQHTGELIDPMGLRTDPERMFVGCEWSSRCDMREFGTRLSYRRFSDTGFRLLRMP